MAWRSFRDLFKGNHSSEWVTLHVNLRMSQYEALSRLADELGITQSRATRRILASFLAELDGAHEQDEDLQ